jgi:hypothetical protein
MCHGEGHRPMTFKAVLQGPSTAPRRVLSALPLLSWPHMGLPSGSPEDVTSSLHAYLNILRHKTRLVMTVTRITLPNMLCPYLCEG